MRLGSLQSDRGPVMDLSRTGLRIISTRKLSGAISIRLFSQEGFLDLAGQVTRCVRLRFRQFDVGVQLNDVAPRIAESLVRIAVIHGLTDEA
jgi:hypothetical protein